MWCSLSLGPFGGINNIARRRYYRVQVRFVLECTGLGRRHKKHTHTHTPCIVIVSRQYYLFLPIFGLDLFFSSYRRRCHPPPRVCTLAITQTCRRRHRRRYVAPKVRRPMRGPDVYLRFLPIDWCPVLRATAN